MSFEVDAVDLVIKNAISVMEDSKYQIFEICEGARSEQKALSQELQQIMEEIDRTIEQVDKLESHYKRSRIRLTEVSKDFKRYNEEDIKHAYETATKLQLDLIINREKELNLKVRRDEMHKRIRNLDRTIERAESLFSQMNVVLEYLSGDLNQLTRILESAKNRQLLGLKIILAQEEERKRIAREMHDGPAQTLANLVLRTEIADRMLGKQEYGLVKEELGELNDQIRFGLEEVRKIIFNLRPMTLDDLGLIPTMRKFVQDFEEKTKIRTLFEMNGIDMRLPSAMEVAVFRLVQEAFSNVLKHANATYLLLKISFQSQMVKIEVKDNGVGFDVEMITQKISRGTHFGLVGMRERIELLDGRLEIESEKTAGTKISMLIPIEMNKKEE